MGLPLNLGVPRRAGRPRAGRGFDSAAGFYGKYLVVVDRSPPAFATVLLLSSTVLYWQDPRRPRAAICMPEPHDSAAWPVVGAVGVFFHLPVPPVAMGRDFLSPPPEISSRSAVMMTSSLQPVNSRVIHRGQFVKCRRTVGFRTTYFKLEGNITHVGPNASRARTSARRRANE
jgi:hypothetical protein